MSLETRFQLILLVASHNGTKNLAGHRMHVEGPQICPENFGVQRFKLAMWNVDGTKIERTRARYICLPWTHTLAKSDFLGKTLRTRKFSKGKFFGAAIHGILMHRSQKM